MKQAAEQRIFEEEAAYFQQTEEEDFTEEEQLFYPKNLDKDLDDDEEEEPGNEVLRDCAHTEFLDENLSESAQVDSLAQMLNEDLEKSQKSGNAHNVHLRKQTPSRPPAHSPEDSQEDLSDQRVAQKSHGSLTKSVFELTSPLRPAAEKAHLAAKLAAAAKSAPPAAKLAAAAKRTSPAAKLAASMVLEPSGAYVHPRFSWEELTGDALRKQTHPLTSVPDTPPKTLRKASVPTERVQKHHGQSKESLDGGKFSQPMHDEWDEDTLQHTIRKAKVPTERVQQNHGHTKKPLVGETFSQPLHDHDKDLTDYESLSEKSMPASGPQPYTRAEKSAKVPMGTSSNKPKTEGPKGTSPHGVQKGQNPHAPPPVNNTQRVQRAHKVSASSSTHPFRTLEHKHKSYSAPSSNSGPHSEASNYVTDGGEGKSFDSPQVVSDITPLSDNDVYLRLGKAYAAQLVAQNPKNFKVLQELGKF